MPTAVLTLYAADGSFVTQTDCAAFSLLKERYLPYDTFHAVYCLTEERLPQPPVRAVFTLDGVKLHDGVVRSVKAERRNHLTQLTLTSRGYTESLMQNQMVPGLYTDVTLDSLMTTYALPHITYESGLSASNYIYVKANTAMWDALSAFCYKYNRSLPYVTRCNHLRLSAKPEDAAILLPAEGLLRYSEDGDASTIISRIDMADIDGTYGQFTCTNEKAAERQIVRVKQMLFDRQFLYQPEDALRYRIAYSNRKLIGKTVSYCGYCGEDIEDMVELSGVLRGHVSRILLRGSENGLETTDTLYFDSFCNVG